MSSPADPALATTQQLVETDETTAKWYDPDIGARLSPGSRSFFSTYSSTSAEDLIPHLHSIVSAVIPPALAAAQITFSMNVPGKYALSPA